jgi:hypothetical protein
LRRLKWPFNNKGGVSQAAPSVPKCDAKKEPSNCEYILHKSHQRQNDFGTSLACWFICIANIAWIDSVGSLAVLYRQQASWFQDDSNISPKEHDSMQKSPTTKLIPEFLSLPPRLWWLTLEPDMVSVNSGRSSTAKFSDISKDSIFAKMKRECSPEKRAHKLNSPSPRLSYQHWYFDCM